jgi:undecaprenyl-phosphate 4-deoxy-4-formamido-L-arabinose transferase
MKNSGKIAPCGALASETPLVETARLSLRQTEGEGTATEDLTPAAPPRSSGYLERNQPEMKVSSTRSISVVVPVYNSEASLFLLIERLEPVLAALSSRYEVILVNDGSKDGSWSAIRKLCANRRWVRGLNLMRNYGQHNALLCGIRAAHFDTTVTMDDDLQHPPEEVFKLLNKLDEGYDVVYGFPDQQQHGLLRDLASELTKLALRGSMGAETARHVSAFRAFRTKTREAFAGYHSPFVSIDVVLTWATTRFAAIKVRHDARSLGVSNYTFRKLFTHAMNMMTGFSTVPLQLANLLGFACTGFGGIILLFVAGRFLLYGTTVPGFTFLACIIAIFSGAQLVALGIMGEYLARMHFRTMERPTYTVHEEITILDKDSL